MELGRLVTEAEHIDDTMEQAGLRKGGESVTLPKTSRLMDELCQQNSLNLLHEKDRQALIDGLKTIKAKAPAIHISFSRDPSAAFMQKLVTWLRAEIHPQILVRVGLQPTIGAGCIVRTTNRQFDMSLRKQLSESRGILVEKLAAEQTREVVS